jgi:DNA-binding XRE family transcriptional regulator
LVKFIPILFVPIIAIIAFRQLRGRVRIRYFVLSAVLGALLVIMLYAPFWNGIESLGLERRANMYTGSVATLARQTLGYLFDGRTGEVGDTPRTNNFLRWAVLILFAVFYFERLDRLYREKLDDDPIFPVRIMTMILLFYMMVSATWFQSWYLIWAVAMAAMLDNTPMRRLILYFSYFATWQSFLYNYVTLRATGWAAIPWRDLIPVAFVQFTAWGYVAYYWIAHWLREAARTPLAVQAGEKLHEARLLLHLSPTDLADKLDLRTDDVIAYENGEKSPSLELAAILGQELTSTTPIPSVQ